MKNTHGGARPNSGPKPTPLNMPRVLALRAQGFSYADIGARFGVSWGVVRRAVVKINSESKQ